MASFVYNSVLTDLVNGDLDFAVDSFKLLLVGVGYTASKDGHDRRNDVSSEISGTGYTAGGNATTCTITNDTNKKILTFSSVSWPSATFTAAGGVIFKARGGASSADELIAYLDFSGEVVSTGGTFSVSTSVITLSN
jgi:hypothetical protein